MRLESVTPTQVRVVLSKRNLLALLSKVDVEDSGKAIYMRYPMQHPAVNDGEPFLLTLLVEAEPDGEHYANRQPGGEMIGWTEEFIVQHEGDDFSA